MISAWFLKKSIFHVIFYKLVKFHWLIAFSSGDMGQYVYFNIGFAKDDVIHFEITLAILSSRFLNDQKRKDKKFKYLKNEKSF